MEWNLYTHANRELNKESKMEDLLENICLFTNSDIDTIQPTHDKWKLDQ